MSDTRYSCELHPMNYTLMGGGKYPTPKGGDTYYWHLYNETPDMIGQDVILAFEKMISIWQAALDEIPPVGRYLKFQSTSDIDKADFIFSFGSGTHKFPIKGGGKKECPFPFDGKSGVLAHMWTLAAGRTYGGQGHFDEAENWSNMHTHNNVRLFEVAMHEMGHGLGIGHSKVREALMYPTYSGTKATLHADDKAGLKAVLQPVKRKVYEIYHKPNEQKEKKFIDRFEALPNWVQVILETLYGDRWA